MACPQASGSASDMPAIGPMTPALLIRTSNRPARSQKDATARSMSAARATSPSKTMPPISSASAEIARASRDMRPTSAPASASTRAVAAPMPRLAPVTRTALPLRSTIPHSCLAISLTDTASKPVHQTMTLLHRCVHPKPPAPCNRRNFAEQVSQPVRKGRFSGRRVSAS